MTSSRPRASTVRRGLLMLGPAFVAAAAYVDPGNVATNTVAGARYGYVLLWVIVIANVMACLVQYLSAKLGLVTGSSLPEILGQRLSRPARIAYWAQAEAVALATDVAEVVGGALALSLLFRLPLVVGGLITVVVSVLVLEVQGRRGQRRFEYLIATMLGIVAVGFVAGLFVHGPDPRAAVAGLVPGFSGRGSVLLAAAMLGATIMPHAIYVHSALVRDRHGAPPPGPDRRRLLAATKSDVLLALLLAGAVNIALILLGAVSLPGNHGAETIHAVHAAIGAHLGASSALLFAIALLFSGIASTSVGCYAGSVVMSGLLRVRMPTIWRRIATAIPALAVLGLGVDPTQALIISQVVLSFGIPFALIPLAVLTSRRSIMGADVNRPLTVAATAVVVVAVVTLNVALLWLTFSATG